MKRKIAIAGATGLVGSHLLNGLLADPQIGEVYALCRNKLNIKHSKLTVLEVDFDELPVLPELDEVYLALGTTIKIAGSQDAFRKVDHVYNLAVAKAALAAGAKKIGVVSAIGANSNAKNFYSRVKGELEAALKELDPSGLVIVRPSILLGDRKALGQPPRKREAISIFIAQLLNPLLPKSLRAIEAKKVANALRLIVPVIDGVQLIESASLHQY